MSLSLAWPTERCSSVAHSGWKKNRDKLNSILVSSEVPPLWGTAYPLYRGSESLPAKPRALPEVTVETPVAKMQTPA